MQVELQELELRYAKLRIVDAVRGARMRASLAADGQQTPVAIIAEGEPAQRRLVLIDGYLRVRAARALASDVVDAVLLPLSEVDALIMAHRLDEVGRRSALEDGWLLEELVNQHGLSQEQLGTRLSRSRSWVSRRLSLVFLLPACAQLAVRDGTIPAQASMKYLVPLSRDKRVACERLVTNLGREPVTERELGRLYTSWRRGDAEQRERIERHPRLFLRADESTRPDDKSDTERLIGELHAISGLCMRARRRLVEGAVELSRARLRRAFREAERGFCTLTELMTEEQNARPVHAHGDSSLVQGGARSSNDRAGAETIA